MLSTKNSSSSPNHNNCYPAMVRSSKDGQWRLNEQHDSDASKLSPRKGGQLRDLEHSRPPYLGPDPHRPLIIQNNNNRKSPSLPPDENVSSNNNNNNNSPSTSAKQESKKSQESPRGININNYNQKSVQDAISPSKQHNLTSRVIQHREASSSPSSGKQGGGGSRTTIKKEVSFDGGLMNALTYQNVGSNSNLPGGDSHSFLHNTKRSQRMASLSESLVSVATNANDEGSPNFGRRVVPKSYANLDRETRKKLLGEPSTSKKDNAEEFKDDGDHNPDSPSFHAFLRNITPPPDVSHLSPAAARRTLNHFREKQQEKIDLERQRHELLHKKQFATSRSRSDLEKDTLSMGIPIDAASTKKSISQFEEKLLRMELRTAEEMEDVSRPETPMMMVMGQHQQQSSSLPAFLISHTSSSGNNLLGGQQQQQLQQQPRKFARQQTFFANIEKARLRSNSGTAGMGSLLQNNNNNNNNTSTVPPALQDQATAGGNIPPPLVNVESPWMLSGASRQALLNAQSGVTGGNNAHSVLLNQLHDFNNNTGKGGSPRAWETLDAKARGRNPIFGILAGIAPHNLRPAFLKIEKEFPTARTKGLDSKAFAKFLSVLTSSNESTSPSNGNINNPISENLVQQSMSYFECNFYIVQPPPPPQQQFLQSPSNNNNNNNNGDDFFSSPNRSPLIQPMSIPSNSSPPKLPSFDSNDRRDSNEGNTNNTDTNATSTSSQFVSTAPVVKRAVPLPQIIIRYGADFSPRYTDSAVVAVFAAMAGMPDAIQRLRPNSALLLSQVRARPIRDWVERTMTSNSAQRRRWIALCDALDAPDVKEELDELLRDVVAVPPDLQRTAMEQRIFGQRQPNGAPLPPPPVMTLDQWRYAVYASEYLLPLVIALRNDVSHGEDDKNAIKKFEKVGG